MFDRHEITFFLKNVLVLIKRLYVCNIGVYFLLKKLYISQLKSNNTLFANCSQLRYKIYKLIQ